MVRVYVAGAYSADNVMGVLHNIGKGIKLSFQVFKAGYAPFCPWLDYHYVLEDVDEELIVPDFYNYSIAFLIVCHAVLLVPGWENSKGTAAELAIADDLSIPVFDNLEELIATFPISVKPI